MVYTSYIKFYFYVVLLIYLVYFVNRSLITKVFSALLVNEEMENMRYVVLQQEFVNFFRFIYLKS